MSALLFSNKHGVILVDEANRELADRYLRDESPLHLHEADVFMASKIGALADTSDIYYIEELAQYFIDPPITEGVVFDIDDKPFTNSINLEIDDLIKNTVKKIIKLSYANDGNFQWKIEAMLEECGDNPQEALEVLAGLAKGWGLEFIRATDFGAEWQGTFHQINGLQENLPDWADIDVKDLKS